MTEKNGWFCCRNTTGLTSGVSVAASTAGKRSSIKGAILKQELCFFFMLRARLWRNSEGLVHFCLWVENLQQEVERLKELNTHFVLKNDEIINYIENGHVCKLKALEGTIVELRDNKGI